MAKTAEDFLEKCDYISQDGDTVYIDEEALIECMEKYSKYCHKEFLKKHYGWIGSIDS